MNSRKSWYVFYTKSRQEKVVNERLIKSGYQVFLPLHTVIRQWSDRKKKVQVPLFNSYIFVFISEHEIPDILPIPGVAWSIRHNGKPAVLRQNEYELIKRFLDTGYHLEPATPEAEELKTGDVATVADGPLAGVTGVIFGDANNEKFSVYIEGINQVIRIKIPAYLVKKSQKA